MFTGIISQTAELKQAKKTGGGIVITIKKPPGWKDLELGESINTDGVCLTVAAIRRSEYDCALMAETLKVTTFGQSMPKKFNLERALKAGDRLGGHFVQGHADCVGRITKVYDDGGRWLDISFPARYRDFVAPKGSISINGVSLTIAKLGKDWLSVSLVGYTLKHTNLGLLRPGEVVNIEFDMIAKHVAQIIKNR